MQNKDDLLRNYMSYGITFNNGKSLIEEMENFLRNIYRDYKDQENVSFIIISDYGKKIIELWISTLEPREQEKYRNFFKNHLLFEEDLSNLAKQIAESLLNKNRAPSLVLLDLMVFHGRKINQILIYFENLVLTELFNSGCNTNDLDIKSCIVHNISIKILFQCDNPLLLLSRYRHNIEYSVLINKIMFNQILTRFMFVVNNDIERINNKYPKEVISVVDEAIYSIGIENEQDAVERYTSGIYFSEETLAKWGRKDYNFEEFIVICNKICQRKNINLLLDAYTIKGILDIREKEGYIMYLNDGKIRAMEPAIMLKVMRYEQYIPVLIAIDKRCNDSRLNLKKELERFKNYLSEYKNEKLDFPVEELYSFMKSLERINQKVCDWNFLFQDALSAEEHQELYRKEVLYLTLYRKI